MKKITNKTILKQGEKTYQPIEVGGMIYWVDNIPSKKGQFCYDKTDSTIFLKEYDSVPHSLTNDNPVNENDYFPIVAQSQPKLDGIPVVSLKTFIALKQTEYFLKIGDLDAGRHFGEGYASNPNQYTQADIERAYKLGYEDRDSDIGFGSNLNYAIEQANSISVIEVDEQFNVISYE